MTQQLQASILSAPLAQIDRRSLSQAWYSALHLARARTPRMPARAPQTIAPTSSQTLPAAAPPTAKMRQHAVRAPAARVVAARRDPPDALCPHALAARALAEKIERAFLNPHKRVLRSTISLGPGEGRVHVLLQGSGDRLLVIAVCRPADRQRVAAALERVRVALAARGRRFFGGVSACS